LQEFKNYCLDKQLFEDYFNKNKFFLVEEDFLQNQPQIISQAQGSPPIIKGTNFLGVSRYTWECIYGKANEGGLYESEPAPQTFIDNNIDMSKKGWKKNYDLAIKQLELNLWRNALPGEFPSGWALRLWNRKKWELELDELVDDLESYRAKSAVNFDCKSFTEAMLIYLKKQLKSICPEASINIVGMTRPAHSILKINLGGTGGCCEGEYFFEPQNGKIYEFGPNGNPIWGGVEAGPYEVKEPQFNWDDGYWPTKWEENDAQVTRMSKLICDCLNRQTPTSSGLAAWQPLNKSEHELKSMCSHFSEENPGKTKLYDHLKNYYSYGKDNINKPGEEVELPSPQSMGCNCNPIDENGDFSNKDCEEGEVCCLQGGFGLTENAFVCISEEDCLLFITPEPTPTPPPPVSILGLSKNLESAIP